MIQMLEEFFEVSPGNSFNLSSDTLTWTESSFEFLTNEAPLSFNSPKSSGCLSLSESLFFSMGTSSMTNVGISFSTLARRF